MRGGGHDKIKLSQWDNVTKVRSDLFKFVCSDPISVPRLDVVESNSAVEFEAERSDTITSRLIVGYTVSRFGIPMIAEYDNLGIRRTVTISPAVAATLYRITAWALDSGNRRSATPAVEDATTEEASKSHF